MKLIGFLQTVWARLSRSQTLATQLSPTPKNVGAVAMLPTQQNWDAQLQDAKRSRIVEYPLYSDAEFHGECAGSLGPYSFLNMVSHGNDRDANKRVRPVVTLRIEEYPNEYREGWETNTDFYHGGHLHDELAALASLRLGVRLLSGNETRSFDEAGDPLGRPSGWKGQPSQLLLSGSASKMIPSTHTTVNLCELDSLASIPTISPDVFVSLVRSARAYQSALWVSDTDANLAWLLLVTALESAANQYNKTNGSEVERLQSAQPELSARLESSSDPDIATDVASMIADMFRSTSKFLTFCVDHLPEEPAERPVRESCQVTWTPKALKKRLSKVYDYRSKALHVGSPFAAPMLLLPERPSGDTVFSELPMQGHSVKFQGGTWDSDDLPFTLDIFHYLTRGILLKWWDSLCPNPKA